MKGSGQELLISHQIQTFNISRFRISQETAGQLKRVQEAWDGERTKRRLRRTKDGRTDGEERIGIKYSNRGHDTSWSLRWISHPRITYSYRDKD